jgi:hypothetical protein
MSIVKKCIYTSSSIERGTFQLAYNMFRGYYNPDKSKIRFYEFPEIETNYELEQKPINGKIIKFKNHSIIVNKYYDIF